MARQRDEDDDRDDDYEEEAPKKKKRGRPIGSFEFDGTAGDFLPVFLLSFLLQMTGIGAPWALCMMKRWECEHTLVNGRRLRFDGNGASALGLIIVTYLLTLITLGIYLFWGIPKIQKWIVENTEFEDA
jgi:uncharacterized membrane protein YjgN (DUF898 family)